MSRLDACYSSKSDEWSTPKELFDELNEEFGFTLDPCSTMKNQMIQSVLAMNVLITITTGKTVGGKMIYRRRKENENLRKN